MKKMKRMALAAMTAIGIMVTGGQMGLPPLAAAVEIVPFYAGIARVNAALGISSKIATCKGVVEMKTTYTGDMTMTLYRDGDNIKSWSTSGTGTLSLSKVYAVTSGHTYQVTVVTKVYNSSGKLVETVVKDSNEVSC